MYYMSFNYILLIFLKKINIHSFQIPIAKHFLFIYIFWFGKILCYNNLINIYIKKS
jgi:hypothetical protein